MRFATVATALALLVTSSIAAPTAALKERSYTYVGGYCSENSSQSGRYYCSTDKQQIECISNRVFSAIECPNSCQSPDPGWAYCT